MRIAVYIYVYIYVYIIVIFIVDELQTQPLNQGINHLKFFNNESFVFFLNCHHILITI
jgi:hypothetical protein